jgi:hypothetical protein
MTGFYQQATCLLPEIMNNEGSLSALLGTILADIMQIAVFEEIRRHKCSHKLLLYLECVNVTRRVHTTFWLGGLKGGDH